MTSGRTLLILALNLLIVIVLSQQCGPGYLRQGKGKKISCIDNNECADDIPPCAEDQDCINTKGSYYCQCKKGYIATTPTTCTDINECEDPDICGPNAKCSNTLGDYSCTCVDGFINNREMPTFRQGDTECQAMDECQYEPCGQNAACHNANGSYYCVCKPGFKLRSGKSSFRENEGLCEDICTIDGPICGNGTCQHADNGGYHCACHAGFTNYGNNESRCAELKCDVFASGENLEDELPVLQGILKQLKNNCLDLTENGTPTVTDFNADLLLEELLSALDKLLSGGDIKDNKKVSKVLNIVENALKLIAPLLKNPETKKNKTHTELEILIRRGGDPPQGPLYLSSYHAELDIQSETAAGIASSYPGFASVSLLTYKNLESFSGMKPSEDLRINSKVVTASVSNKDTDLLKDPVVLTFSHLTQEHEANHTCVYWDFTKDGGAWSSRGCSVVNSTSDITVCSCNHLSSFAVLMALYDVEHTFELQLITWVGLSLSLLCLLLCILTFALIRSIQSPRNSIHLHLCISLFIANLIFLAGISRTENQTGCAVVAGLLHFFYLAAFCWMCLEGIQLFRMVVLVFNTSFKRLYMMAGGYGVPAVIVIVSAIANAKGYGTTRHCWLSLENGFIWGFFGPACAIIMINIFFFLITVWKLAQKFSSLNPDLDNLHKIKAFIITAVAQLCVLGTMWIFGCFQFDESTMAISYLFTLVNSLQGVLLFVLHCLLSKQVREEYGKLMPSIRSPQKKYSDFSNSQSSKALSSKSGQNTGESHI